MNTETLSREAFAARLVDFLTADLPLLHTKAAGHETFDAASLLFEAGGIDSLSIIHIVAFLESAIGQPLSLQDIHMKNFRTVHAIADLYWLRKNDARVS